MPGIVGIISQRPAEECESLVEAMLASMKYESSYVSSMHTASEMGIYAGWVAHESSFAAEQVFFNEERDIALVLSGECFVDSETRTDLREKGHKLERSNGGWLVHLYEEEGDRFFEKLNGLFSGLLIDKRKGKAFLFNDRYGVERIYWHQSKDAFYFASEAKALLRILPELREFDTNGVAEFLAVGCTFQGRTLFRGIDFLEGGSLWCFENGKCHKGKYFSLDLWEAASSLSAELYEAEFEETFKRILPRYLESESKIGISLTAGLDSRMIMACLPATLEKPVCYTFSGQERDTLDARLAAKVSSACGLEHQILRIGQDFFSDFASLADRTIYITDGTLGPLGTHEVYMNRKASRLSPMRLTGNYGSEILRALSTFKSIELSRGLLNPDFARRTSSCAEGLVKPNGHAVTFAAFQEIPWSRFGVLAAGRSQAVFRTPYLDNQIVALAYQAPENLRRSPLPALRLIERNKIGLSRIPTDMGELGKDRRLTVAPRRIFSKATFKLDYLYNEGLPHWLSRLDPWLRRANSRVGIVGSHKFLHYRSWFQRELAAYVDEALTRAQTKESQFWNSDFVETMAREHRIGRKNYVREINAVLALEAVERLLFRDLPRKSQFAGTTAARGVQSTATKNDRGSDLVTTAVPV